MHVALARSAGSAACKRLFSAAAWALARICGMGSAAAPIHNYAAPLCSLVHLYLSPFFHLLFLLARRFAFTFPSYLVKIQLVCIFLLPSKILTPVRWRAPARSVGAPPRTAGSDSPDPWAGRSALVCGEPERQLCSERPQLHQSRHNTLLRPAWPCYSRCRATARWNPIGTFLNTTSFCHRLRQCNGRQTWLARS